MVLDFNPPPIFSACNKKVFREDELHITRVCKRSVLILMLDGVLRFREAGRDIELTAGEYYIQEEGLFQDGVRLGESPVYYYVEFNGKYSDGDNGLAIRGKYDKDKIIPIMKRLGEQYAVYHADLFLLNSYMLRIFSELVGNVSSVKEQNHVASLIKRYIDSMYTNQLTISDIAKKFGYTEDYIIRIFKAKYGITPHKYQIKLRMEQARWLLENTEMTSEQVGISVGYSEFSAFYRKFKDFYALSPGAVREGAFAKEGEPDV